MEHLIRKIKKLKSVILEQGPHIGLTMVLWKYLPSPLDGIFYVLNTELKEAPFVDLPIRQRMRALRYGFSSRVYLAYDIPSSSDHRNYLSEFSAKIGYTKMKKNPELLTNKLLFYKFMKGKNFGKYLPDFFGHIKLGTFYGKYSILDILKTHQKIVIKPIYGCGGEGIYFVFSKNYNLLINGEEKTVQELKGLIKTLDYHIVTEYCVQSKFLQNINPYSANTARILTLWPKDGKPFIAHAYLRIGSKKSGFIDNLSFGGYTSEIDLETGHLSQATTIPKSGKTHWTDIHPDTKATIKGTLIPNWKSFKKEFLDMISKFNEFTYVGWDILFTDDNKFVIIEGNNTYIGYRGHQVHYPLLKDPRIKKFYLDYDVPL